MRPKAEALGYERVRALEKHTLGLKPVLVRAMRPKAEALGYERVQALESIPWG
jgi:hypothetical protein